MIACPCALAQNTIILCVLNEPIENNATMEMYSDSHDCRYENILDRGPAKSLKVEDGVCSTSISLSREVNLRKSHETIYIYSTQWGYVQVATEKACVVKSIWLDPCVTISKISYYVNCYKV